jgi:hypothetical protein
VAYVIAHATAHATAVSELLTAFVGPSYTFFDGLPARLDPADPIDQAVLELAGPATTFTMLSPTRSNEARAWEALQQMQKTVARRPVRSWHVPKPVGRVLAEFEVALAAGDNTASAALLDQLAASGGLSGPNLAHLRIKRLARLGRDGELLRLAELPDVVTADPPLPVKDAILAAIFTSAIAEPLRAGDLEAASENLVTRGSLVPLLLNTNYARLQPESLCVLALAARVRGDNHVVHRLLTDPATRAAIDQQAPQLVTAAEEHRGQIPPIQPTPPDAASTSATMVEPRVRSWPDLLAAIVRDRDEAHAVLREQAWRDWPPPAATDQALADLLASLDDTQAERAWSFVGAFVDADGYRDPAPRSAHELIHNALAYNRFSPGDLAGLAALTEIVLRAGPSSNDYRSLLDDMGADCDRWVGPERASVALDLADLLVRAACPDHEARLRLALTLLTPLNAHRHRLDTDVAAFARRLSRELQTGLDWPDEPGHTRAVDTLAGIGPLKVLLYSLDLAVLERTGQALRELAPQVSVQVRHDRVGSPQLRQHARHADIIVLATRCATHAATGFIRASASSHATVREADGSGSASLLRAAVSSLQVAGRNL